MSPEACLTNRIRQLRIARGWSQEELARRSGVSRPSVSAIETNRLVPSTAAALAIAGALGCRVEDAFSLGDPSEPAGEWAWPPLREPCRFWHAEVGGRKLRYPVEPTLMGMVGFDGVFAEGAFREHSQAAPHETLVMACCDPAVGLLAAQLASMCGLRLLALQRSSREALSLLKRGLVHVAGLHFARADDPDGNVSFAREVVGSGFCLLHLTSWEEGVALRPNLGLSSFREILASPLRWVGRQPGSGARMRQDELLGDREPPEHIAYDHRGVADAIRCGWADAGICHRLVSEEMGLDFLGYEREAYHLCWLAELEEDRRLQGMLEATRSRAYRQTLAELPGFDARLSGALLTVG